MDFITIPASTQGPFEELVVIAHGYGANCDDLLFMKDRLKGRGKTLYVFPNAPEICPGGFGYQWFPLDDITPKAIQTALKPALPSYESFIRGLQKEYHISPDSTVLVGFSQGAMMSLGAGLSAKEPLCSRIIAFSGMLVNDVFHKSAFSPKVLFVHGTHDTIVPAEASKSAYDFLTKEGVSTELLLIPGMGHTIDETGLERATLFLEG